MTPPKDIWNVTGAQVYLSCEVIGIPTPVLIWNKVSGTDFWKTSWTDRLLSLHKDGNNQTSSACSVACCSSKAKPAAVFQTTPQDLWTDFTDLGGSLPCFLLAVAEQGASGSGRTIMLNTQTHPLSVCRGCGGQCMCVRVCTHMCVHMGACGCMHI